MGNFRATHTNHLQLRTCSLIFKLLIGFTKNQSREVFRLLYNDVQEFVHACLSYPPAAANPQTMKHTESRLNGTLSPGTKRRATRFPPDPSLNPPLVPDDPPPIIPLFVLRETAQRLCSVLALTDFTIGLSSTSSSQAHPPISRRANPSLWGRARKMHNR